ncbi:MAG: hypothetical protein U0R49_07925 [Fimbriimonadales bacterium]
MNKLMRVALLGAAIVTSVSVLADNSDTFTFPNNTGQAANDLHIVWSRAVKIESNTEFKKQSGSDSNKSDFKKGSVANGDSCEVKVSWDGTDPEIKSWYWTNDGKKIRDEKIGDVTAIDTNESNGLVAVTVKNSEGALTAFLPSELVSGTTIRGTVIMTPNGNDSSTLRGSVLQIGESKLPSNGGAFVATLGAGATALTLMNSSGSPIAKVPLPCIPNNSMFGPGSLPFDGMPKPGLVASGKPFSVPGNFNPSETFSAKINGSDATVLAASNWNATVMPSGNLLGNCNVEVMNGNAITKFSANAVNIELLSSRNTLMAGETANITLKVGPFTDAPSSLLPAEISIVNHTPSTLNLGDKNNCVITIRPEDISSDGFYTCVLSGTALAPGGFVVSGQLAGTSCGAKTHEFGIDKLNKGKDNKGWYIEWREDCHEGTCHLKKGHAGDHAFSWKKCQTHDSKDHKDYYSSEEDRDAAYRKLEKEAKERAAKNGF